MKYILPLFFIIVAIAGVYGNEHCYTETQASCKHENAVEMCNANYGNINTKNATGNSIATELNSYLCEHIGLSYKNLRLATNFNSYMRNREGLYKLFKGLSDEAWETAIDIVKYITKRGGVVDVSQCPSKWTDSIAEEATADNKVFSLTEIGALTRALGWYKTLAVDSFKIHSAASHHNHYDPEVSSYIENKFVQEYAKVIRQLTGYVNDLAKLVSGKEPQLGMYLFDEHLKKLL